MPILKVARLGHPVLRRMADPVPPEALGRDGQALGYAAEGFHARILQHEMDHLDGKVYLDRMRSMESLAFLPEFQRYGLKRSE